MTIQELKDEIRTLEYELEYTHGPERKAVEEEIEELEQRLLRKERDDCTGTERDDVDQ